MAGAQGGEAAAGHRELREALEVHRLTGAPLEDLGELGQLAGARGMDPGQLMREVATAGMETTVTPSAIMRGARSIGAFGTPEEAIATLAVLSKQLGPRGGDGEPNVTVAISPLFALEAEDVAAKADQLPPLEAGAAVYIE